MAALHSSTSTKAREDRAIYRALNILKNRMREPGQQLNDPSAVRDYLRLLLAERDREIFVCLFLDARNRLIEAETLFYGSLTQTSVYPREVVRRALHHNAAAVIFAHNHPSGLPDPSRADMLLTTVLKDALLPVEVKALDHFIVAGNELLSFAEMGIMGGGVLPTPLAAPAAKRRGKPRKQSAQAKQ